jgi:arginine metabolism regulation protein II
LCNNLHFWTEQERQDDAIAAAATTGNQSLDTLLDNLDTMSQCQTQSGSTWSGPFGLLTFDSVATADDDGETRLAASRVAMALTDVSQVHQARPLEDCGSFDFDDLFMLSEHIIPAQSQITNYQDLSIETGELMLNESPTLSLLGFPLKYSEDLADLSFSVVRQLLDHYQQHVITLYTPAPSKSESPWKILHVPKVMSSFGEVMLTGNGADVNLCLLFAILATSAFSMQPDPEHPSECMSSWRDLGESFKTRAKSRLKLALTRISPHNPETFKYKDFLMALLSMVTTGVRTFIPRDRLSC